MVNLVSSESKTGDQPCVLCKSRSLDGQSVMRMYLAGMLTISASLHAVVRERGRSMQLTTIKQILLTNLCRHRKQSAVAHGPVEPKMAQSLDSVGSV